MDFEITAGLFGDKLSGWRRLIESSGLVAEGVPERVALVYDGEKIVATGSRDGCVLKYIAVDGEYRGEDLTAKVLTELRRDAFESGYTHLFLYTKPKNRYTFESLFFYTVVESENVLVMENAEDGIESFLDGLPEKPTDKRVGAIVMNCNPFTLGHQHLIEVAASECDEVFVFVLSEDKSEFSAADRLEMVKLGAAHLKNVTVLSTGPYLISSATFPTYFIKDRDIASGAACEVDIEIFSKRFSPRLAITHRYVGTEPNSTITAEYNAALKEKLPKANIELREVERITAGDKPISASRVREIIKSGDAGELVSLLPKTTLDYLREKKYI